MLESNEHTLETRWEGLHGITCIKHLFGFNNSDAPISDVKVGMDESQSSPPTSPNIIKMTACKEAPVDLPSFGRVSVIKTESLA